MNNNLNNFDDNIKNLVEGYSHTFNNAAWDDLETRLNKPNELIYKVFQYKLIEAALLFLMLWFALNHNNSDTYESASNKATKFKPLNNTEAANQQVSQGAEAKENQKLAHNYDGNQNRLIHNEEATQTQASKVYATMQANPIAEPSFNKTATATKASNKSANNTPSSQLTQVVAPEKLSNSGQISSSQFNPTTTSTTIPNQATTPQATERQSTYLDYLKSLAYNPDMPLIMARRAVGPEFARSSVKPKATKLPLSLFGAFSPDYNTFSNTSKATTGFSLYAGAEKYLSKRFVLQLGANYRYVQYLTESSTVEQTNEFNITNNMTRAISVNMLSFQASTKLIIFENKDLLLYGRLGLLSDFIVGNSVKCHITTMVNNAVVQEANVATALESEEKGLMQSGNVANNMLLSADVGIGTEFKATKNTSLFIEALYNKGITSGGLHNEQINKSALKFGFKYTLK
jgi:hypothetical protein